MSAPERKVRKEQVLSPTEVEGLEREIREFEDSKKETETTYTPSGSGESRHGGQSSHNDANIRRYKKVLEQGKPGSVGRSEFILREKQMAKDREWLQKNMVPKSHVSLRASPDPEFRKAVNFMAQREMSREFQEVAQRYKNNARMLHPDDRELHNIETIRPDKT